jgi:hypothetical protein
MVGGPGAAVGEPGGGVAVGTPSTDGNCEDEG